MNKVFYTLVVLAFLFTSLNLTESLNVTGTLLVYSTLMFMMVIPLFLKVDSFHTNPLILFVIYFFLLSCLISSLINQDINSVFASFALTMLMVVSFIIAPMLNTNINQMIFRAILVSQLPILIVPILINGIDTTPYKGIFYNPNSLGTISATVFAILLAYFIGNFEKSLAGIKGNHSRSKNFIQLALILYIFYLVSLSGSRTSFLSVLCCIVIAILCCMVFIIRKKGLKSFILRAIGFVLFIVTPAFLLIKDTSWFQIYFANIIDKFTTRSSEGDVLSSRGMVWNRAINEAGMFGNGNEYFVNLKIGAHNSFISILGQYGWIPMLIFVTLFLICFYYIAKFTLRNTNDKYKYIPLFLFVSFVSMSMAEEMIFKLSMVAMFLSLGSVVFKNDEKTL